MLVDMVSCFQLSSECQFLASPELVIKSLCFLSYYFVLVASSCKYLQGMSSVVIHALTYLLSLKNQHLGLKHIFSISSTTRNNSICKLIFLCHDYSLNTNSIVCWDFQLILSRNSKHRGKF